MKSTRRANIWKHAKHFRIVSLNFKTFRKRFQFLDETFQTQLHKTIENQEQIRRTTIELQEKLEVSKLVRVVQEIQMWQEEAIEIIRMLDRTQPASIQEANELIDRVHDLQQTIEHKSARIQEVKKMSQGLFATVALFFLECI